MLVRATEELSAKKIVVVGLGVSGAAAARFAIKCGATVLVTDSRPASQVPVSEELIGLGAEFVSDTVAESMLVGADMVVASPGVPRSAQLLIAAKERGVEVLSDIELASRYIDVPVIAVAGTNGKSTVVTLIGEIMEAAGKSLFIGGNIGTPVTEYFNLDTRPDLCLLEVSSFQLEHIDTFAPKVAVMLNITEDHLERYDGFDDYAATKLAIFDKQGADCLAVVNAGDLKIASILTVRGTGFVGHPPNAPRVVPYTITGTIGDGLYLRESRIVYAGAEAGEGEVYSTERCSLKGLHNIENMMAAIAVARLLHIDKEIIEEVLSRFKGLRHRMETVRTLGGVTYIDDSKGTNVGALKMALKGIDSPVVLIAGGVDKGGDYSALLPLVKEKVERMILIGESRHKMERALGNVTDTVMVETLEEAVKIASESAKDGTVVLLCPAGASFDMFKSYAERGERFSSSVMALEAGNG
jgi:UDP-N-acetylmuramoylalanine--D-glutamate ligase